MITIFAFAPLRFISARVLSRLKSLPPQIGFVPHLRIDRNQKGLLGRLDPIPAEVEESCGARADLAHERIEGALHVLLAEVLLELNFKFVAAQFLGEGTSVRDRGGEGRAGIGISRIPNDQRHPWRAWLRLRHTKQRYETEQYAQP